MTYTVSILEINIDSYNDILTRIKAIGYEHMIMADGISIDMTHVAVRPEPAKPERVITPVAEGVRARQRYKKKQEEATTYWIQIDPFVERIIVESLLKDMGVEVGPWEPNESQWKHCKITEEQFKHMEPFWNAGMLWGPERS